MRNKIDWRDPESLRGISPAQALMVLGELNAVLANRKEATETMDDAEDRRWANLSVSVEAQDLADAARRFHRRAVASVDCRPSLRVAAEERRETLDAKEKPCQTPEECAEEYASAMRAFHRR